MILRLPDDLVDLHDGILQMRGDDFEVFLVEGNELEKVHDTALK